MLSLQNEGEYFFFFFFEMVESIWNKWPRRDFISWFPKQRPDNFLDVVIQLVLVGLMCRKVG